MMSEVISSFRNLRAGSQVFALLMLFLCVILHTMSCDIDVTDHWGEPCNRTGEVHLVDPFHSLDNFKNHFASIAFCRNSVVYNVWNGAVIELSFVVSMRGFPRH